MSKRWTEKEDNFIVAYFDAVGDYIGPHDLGRPKGAAKKRAEHLKATGAWAVLELQQGCNLAYRLALGLPVMPDMDGTNIETATDIIAVAQRFSDRFRQSDFIETREVSLDGLAIAPVGSWRNEGVINPSSDMEGPAF